MWICSAYSGMRMKIKLQTKETQVRFHAGAVMIYLINIPFYNEKVGVSGANNFLNP
jgi:hypothetical protein